MKISKLYTGIISLFFFLSSFEASAAAPEWKIIPEKSSITFTAIQNGAPVTGQFKNFTGEIFVDPKDYKSSSVHIVVDISSITSSYSDITSTLSTPDWFNVKMYPKAEFKSTSFNKVGDKKYQAMGTLTLRGKSLPVTLTFTAEETSPGVGTVEGSTVLKRTDFGIGQGDWSSTKEIKDEVKVNFKIVAKEAASS